METKMIAIQAREERETLRQEKESKAMGGLFQAIVWGYFGSAAGLLALALLGLSGAHIPWVHIARGIVTGS